MTASRDVWNQSYDFIIVGAGTAGCVIASKLADDPNVTVLLLEAGGAADAIYNDLFWLRVAVQNQADIYWRYNYEPQEYVGFEFANGRMPELAGRLIGGTSAVNNHGLFLLNNREDRRLNQNTWAQKYGALGWDYKDVIQYFTRFENQMGVKEMGYNHSNTYQNYPTNGNPIQLAPNSPQPPFFQRLQRVYDLFYRQNFDQRNQNQGYFLYLRDSHGFRVTSATAYNIDPNLHPQNLHIVTSAQVIRIIFNGTTAVGVQFARNSFPFTVYARREVILSAGPYNTPQLLMLSGVGLKDHLQSFGIPVVMELPVGNNLMNHILAAISGNITDPNYYYLSLPQLNLDQLSERYFNYSGPLGLVPILQTMWSTPRNQIKTLANGAIGHLLTVDGRGFNIGMFITTIRSRGTVRLQSTDPFIVPRIDPNIFGDSRDFEDLIDLLRSRFYILENPKFNISSIASIPTLESVGCSNPCPGRYLYECTEGLVCYLGRTSLPSDLAGGTCRMGAVHRDDVVVDPQLRVKNIKRLRICDSSIVPEIPAVFPIDTIYMIGEKCAQIIKDCYHLN